MNDLLPEGTGANLEYFIGNTSPHVDEYKLITLLLRCNKQITDLECRDKLGRDDIEVECLTSYEHPRSRSWKISVPHKFRTMFENVESFLCDWTHRRFYPKQRTGARSGPPRRDWRAGTVGPLHHEEWGNDSRSMDSRTHSVSEAEA